MQRLSLKRRSHIPLRKGKMSSHFPLNLKFKHDLGRFCTSQISKPSVGKETETSSASMFEYREWDFALAQPLTLSAAASYKLTN